MARFAGDRKRRSLARGVKTAILVGSNLAFGFARMYQELIEHPQITVGVFRNRDAALAWLGAEPAQRPGCQAPLTQERP
jgi:hypothetical protein